MSRRVWAPLVAVVILLVLVGGYLAWSALKSRDAQIAALQGDVKTRDSEISGLRGDLERRTSELRSARDDLSTARSDLTLRQQQLDAALKSAQEAQQRAAELDGRVVGLESQLQEANRRVRELEGFNTQNPLPSEPVAGPDLTPILAIDDRLLEEGTTYINLTLEAETAIRANDYDALGVAFGKLQASRARWDALVKQRNDAIAAMQAP